MKPSVQYIQECFNYCPNSGVITWKVRPREHFPTQRGYSIFNTKHAGNETGTIGKIGHKIITLNDTSYYAHILIWVLAHGRWPELTIDHKNRNPSDNRLVNLREATQPQQNANQGLRKNNSSGHAGVCWNNKTNKWRAYITVNSKQINLGYYANKEDAIKARENAEIKYFGDFRRKQEK